MQNALFSHPKKSEICMWHIKIPLMKQGIRMGEREKFLLTKLSIHNRL